MSLRKMRALREKESEKQARARMRLAHQIVSSLISAQTKNILSRSITVVSTTATSLASRAADPKLQRLRERYVKAGWVSVPGLFGVEGL